MAIASLLNTPKTPEDWQRWSFVNAQEHLKIIRRIQALTGNVINVTLTNGGSKYTSLPEVILDSSGSGASFNMTIKGGVIQTISVASEGQGYQSAAFHFSGGGGSGATATIELNPVVYLPQYQLDPINFVVPADFIGRHSQAHTDMNSVLGLQSVDLNLTDFQDANKIQAWIYSNYQEHDNAYNKLGL